MVLCVCVLCYCWCAHVRVVTVPCGEGGWVLQTRHVPASQSDHFNENMMFLIYRPIHVYENGTVSCIELLFVVLYNYVEI